MQPESEKKPKKAPRKHVTTACVSCRESKIRVCWVVGLSCLSCFRIFGLSSYELELLLVVSTCIFILYLTRDSATGLPRIAAIAKEKGRIANTNMGMTSASKYQLAKIAQTERTCWFREHVSRS